MAGSSDWQSACVRVANWVRLTDRDSGVQFRVVNTHLDHVSQAARQGDLERIQSDRVLIGVTAKLHQERQADAHGEARGKEL